MMFYAAILCGALLLFVTLAFIFSEKFRSDVVVGEGGNSQGQVLHFTFSETGS